MSTDPYCFVELTSKSQADRTMQEINRKEILGRPVKLGPDVAASKKRKFNNDDYANTRKPPVFQRWTSTDASNHFQGYSDQGRRVWAGGLPPMGEHSAVKEGVRDLFAGFEMYVRAQSR